MSKEIPYYHTHKPSYRLASSIYMTSYFCLHYQHDLRDIITFDHHHHLAILVFILDCYLGLGDVKRFGVVDNLSDCRHSNLKRRKKQESMLTSSLPFHLPSCGPNWFSTSTAAPLVCFPQNSNSCNNSNFQRAKASLCLKIRGTTLYISPIFKRLKFENSAPIPILSMTS